MRSLSDTIARLKGLQTTSLQAPPTDSRLLPFRAEGPNPGQLNGWIYVPERIASGAPLVVVLHGCTQSAAGYDESSGWSRLAEQHGFAVLYPEQQRSNNPNLCFNWFSGGDASRDQGEALSIREMVRSAQARFACDPQRTFVTGLSAGGAMAAVMLATYPEVFAGGAVIAGLPYGVANSVPEAFDRMRGHDRRDSGLLSKIVQRAANHDGDWPILSVWHGSADATVDHSNALALIEQWRPLHGAPEHPSETNLVNGYPHQVWRNPQGREVVELYTITGLAHGTPLDTRSTDHGERAAPFMLEAGVSSTHLIARFWDIVPDRAGQRPVTVSAELDTASTPQPRAPTESDPHAGQAKLQKTIEDALRTAGLMR